MQSPDFKNFYKDGFFVIKNLLNKNEIEKYLVSINAKRNSLLNQKAATISDGVFKIKSSDTRTFKEYSEYDDKNLWDYVVKN